MARIRTTKPEYYTSEQVMNLSIPARFAFQGLWNFCDDGGNHPASAKTLKAEVFPSDDLTSTEVQALVDEMLAQGLLVLYQAAGKQYWHVTGWHHQRIDKPTLKHPAYAPISPSAPIAVGDKSAVETGVNAEDSPNGFRPLAEDSTSTLGVLHPGVEGIGREGNVDEGKEDSFRLSADAPKPAPTSKQKDLKSSLPKEEPKTNAVWQAYSEAYAKRYGVEPLRNAKVNGALANLLKRVPADEAPSIAGFYVRSEDRFYVGACHPVDLLLRDCEKLRTATVTGHDFGRMPSKHAGFDRMDYQEGINADGSIAA